MGEEESEKPGNWNIWEHLVKRAKIIYVLWSGFHIQLINHAVLEIKMLALNKHKYKLNMWLSHPD